MEVETISKKLKPLYQEMLDASKTITENGDYVKFCLQWGREFPFIDNDGIIFFGRASNGWMCFDDNAEQIFDLNNSDRAFARDDQMTWVDDCACENACYNSNRSAFWRVIRGVTKAFYPNDGLQYIAWSNLCKIAPDGGNPSNALYYAQLDAAKKIMAAEIELFCPKHIVLLTGKSWAEDFLKFLNGGSYPLVVEEIGWGKKYSVRVFKIGEVYYYLSEHPQGKNESTHVNALVDAISKR